MRRRISRSLILLFMVANVRAPAYAQPIASTVVVETPHLQFVAEYLRELAEVETLRQRAEDDLAAHGPDLADCIRNMTSLNLALLAHTASMRGMKLHAPFETLPANIGAFDENKASIYEQYGDACSNMIAGPRPGVDYQALAGKMPKLTAQLDYIDHALMEASPLVFATLIDLREDAAGHANHLIITNAERQQIIDRIESDFGTKLQKPNANYIVSSAIIIETYLKKDFKGADEPW